MGNSTSLNINYENNEYDNEYTYQDITNYSLNNKTTNIIKTCNNNFNSSNKNNSNSNSNNDNGDTTNVSSDVSSNSNNEGIDNKIGAVIERKDSKLNNSEYTHIQNKLFTKFIPTLLNNETNEVPITPIVLNNNNNNNNQSYNNTSHKNDDDDDNDSTIIYLKSDERKKYKDVCINLQENNKNSYSNLINKDFKDEFKKNVDTTTSIIIANAANNNYKYSSNKNEEIKSDNENKNNVYDHSSKNDLNNVNIDSDQNIIKEKRKIINNSINKNIDHDNNNNNNNNCDYCNDKKIKNNNSKKIKDKKSKNTKNKNNSIISSSKCIDMSNGNTVNESSSCGSSNIINKNTNIHSIDKDYGYWCDKSVVSLVSQHNTKIVIPAAMAITTITTTTATIIKNGKKKDDFSIKKDLKLIKEKYFGVKKNEVKNNSNSNSTINSTTNFTIDSTTATTIQNQNSATTSATTSTSTSMSTNKSTSTSKSHNSSNKRWFNRLRYCSIFDNSSKRNKNTKVNEETNIENDTKIESQSENNKIDIEVDSQLEEKTFINKNIENLKIDCQINNNKDKNIKILNVKSNNDNNNIDNNTNNSCGNSSGSSSSSSYLVMTKCKMTPKIETLNLLPSIKEPESPSDDLTGTTIVVVTNCNNLEELTSEVLENESSYDDSTIEIVETESPIESSSTEIVETESPIKSSSTEIVETESSIESSSTEIVETESPIEPSSTEIVETESSIESDILEIGKYSSDESSSSSIEIIETQENTLKEIQISNLKEIEKEGNILDNVNNSILEKEINNFGDNDDLALETEKNNNINNNENVILEKEKSNFDNNDNSISEKDENNLDYDNNSILEKERNNLNSNDDGSILEKEISKENLEKEGQETMKIEQNYSSIEKKEVLDINKTDIIIEPSIQNNIKNNNNNFVIKEEDLLVEEIIEKKEIIKKDTDTIQDNTLNNCIKKSKINENLLSDTIELINDTIYQDNSIENEINSKLETTNIINITSEKGSPSKSKEIYEQNINKNIDIKSKSIELIGDNLLKESNSLVESQKNIIEEGNNESIIESTKNVINEVNIEPVEIIEIIEIIETKVDSITTKKDISILNNSDTTITIKENHTTENNLDSESINDKKENPIEDIFDSGSINTMKENSNENSSDTELNKILLKNLDENNSDMELIETIKETINEINTEQDKESTELVVESDKNENQKIIKKDEMVSSPLSTDLTDQKNINERKNDILNEKIVEKNENTHQVALQKKQLKSVLKDKNRNSNSQCESPPSYLISALLDFSSEAIKERNNPNGSSIIIPGVENVVVRPRRKSVNFDRNAFEKVCYFTANETPQEIRTGDVQIKEDEQSSQSIQTMLNDEVQKLLSKEMIENNEFTFGSDISSLLIKSDSSISSLSSSSLSSLPSSSIQATITSTSSTSSTDPDILTNVPIATTILTSEPKSMISPLTLAALSSNATISNFSLASSSSTSPSLSSSSSTTSISISPILSNVSFTSTTSPSSHSISPNSTISITINAEVEQDIRNKCLLRDSSLKLNDPTSSWSPIPRNVIHFPKSKPKSKDWEPHISIESFELAARFEGQTPDMWDVLEVKLFVQNLDYHKHVFIRYTINDWSSYNEEEAKYSGCVREGTQGNSVSNDFGNNKKIGLDRFIARIDASDLFVLPDCGRHTCMQRPKKMLLVARYDVLGTTYWDNNHFTDYELELVRIPAGYDVPRHHGYSKISDASIIACAACAEEKKEAELVNAKKILEEDETEKARRDTVRHLGGGKALLSGNFSEINNEHQNLDFLMNPNSKYAQEMMAKSNLINESQGKTDKEVISEIKDTKDNQENNEKEVVSKIVPVKDNQYNNDKEMNKNNNKEIKPKKDQKYNNNTNDSDKNKNNINEKPCYNMSEDYDITNSKNNCSEIFSFSSAYQKKLENGVSTNKNDETKPKNNLYENRNIYSTSTQDLNQNYYPSSFSSIYNSNYNDNNYKFQGDISSYSKLMSYSDLYSQNNEFEKSLGMFNQSSRNGEYKKSSEVTKMNEKVSSMNNQNYYSMNNIKNNDYSYNSYANQQSSFSLSLTNNNKKYENVSSFSYKYNDLNDSNLNLKKKENKNNFDIKNSKSSTHKYDENNKNLPNNSSSVITSIPIKNNFNLCDDYDNSGYGSSPEYNKSNNFLKMKSLNFNSNSLTTTKTLTTPSVSNTQADCNKIKINKNTEIEAKKENKKVSATTETTTNDMKSSYAKSNTNHYLTTSTPKAAEKANQNTNSSKSQLNLPYSNYYKSLDSTNICSNNSEKLNSNYTYGNLYNIDFRSNYCNGSGGNYSNPDFNYSFNTLNGTNDSMKSNEIQISKPRSNKYNLYGSDSLYACSPLTGMLENCPSIGQSTSSNANISTMMNSPTTSSMMFMNYKSEELNNKQKTNNKKSSEKTNSFDKSCYSEFEVSNKKTNNQRNMTSDIVFRKDLTFTAKSSDCESYSSTNDDYNTLTYCTA